MLLAASAVPNAAADDLRDEQRTLRSKVRAAQGDLQESSRTLSAAARRLNAARAALSASQRRLAVAQSNVTTAARLDAEMQTRLRAAEHELTLARTALEAAEKRVLAQRAEIGALAASNYAHGDPALMGISVILNSQNPSEATTQMNTVDALMNKQTVLLDELKAARVRMVAEEAKVEQAKEAVAAQRRQARENLERKQTLERSAATARAEVATLVTRGRAAELVAGRARQADLAELRAAKQQEDKVRSLIMSRAARQSGGYQGGAGGFLLRPVPGGVTSAFGYRQHPIYGYYGLHDGTDFSAPCGTAERAVASGTVISTYSSSVYGNRLYLDVGRVNGKNMTVVYNHLSAYRASAGQRVSRGQVVGLAGDTGWSTGCHLHFTVLLDGSPVNPLGYL